MKTEIRLNMCCGAFALLMLLPLASRASESASNARDQKGDPPTHVLFSGSDIQVHQKGALHHVRGVEGDAFVTKVDDRNVKLG